MCQGILTSKYRSKMKKILMILALVAVVASCKKDEIDMFDPNHQMIRWTQSFNGFSFRDNPAGGELRIPFHVVGNVADVDRHAEFDIIMRNSQGEDMTTFPLNRFEIVSAIVPAGEVEGELVIRFERPVAGEVDDPDDFETHLLLTTADGGDFYKGPEVSQAIDIRNLDITVSTYLVRPQSWPSWQAGGPGYFSSSYYQFIIDNMDGEEGFSSEIREFPFTYVVEGVNNDQVWTVQQRVDFLSTLEDKVASFNSANPETPLTHDSGEAKGFLVDVGRWTYQ